MRAPTLILSVCLLAGCAAPPPENPRHAADLAACRHIADQAFSDDAIDPADEHSTSPMVMAHREEVRDKYDSMVDHCMTDLPPFTDAPPKTGTQQADTPK